MLLMEDFPKVKTVVIGIGNLGNDVINCMLAQDVCEMKFIHINTDEKNLESIWVSKEKVVGIENRMQYKEISKDTDMAFIVFDMESENNIKVFLKVAQFFKKRKILTIGMLAIPFETKQKRVYLIKKSEDFKRCIDTLFVFSLQDVSENIEDVISQGIKSIIDAVNKPALIGLDFADINIAMKNRGFGCIGIGRAKGVDKAIKAAKKAYLQSPFLKSNILDAKLIVTVVFGDITLLEAHDAELYIVELVPNSDMLLSMRYEEEVVDEVVVMYIAVGDETLLMC